MSFAVRKFRGLLLAATASMLIEYLMGLSDSIVSGNMLGESALAAINLLQTPMNFVTFVSCLIGTGTAILFSLEVGRFDRKRANEMFSTGFWGAIGTGIVVLVGLVLVRDAFLSALGPSADVRTLATSYWLWYVPCAVLEPLAFLLASACYADGDGRLCIGAYVVQFAGNVIFSIALVKMMGIGGCALGTVLGNLGAIAVLLFHFRKASNTLALMRYFRVRDLVRLCRSSFGDASTRLWWAALFFLLNKYVIEHHGSAMLPVAGVVVALLGISEAFNGVPNAAQPLIGVYMGEKNYRQIRMVMRAAGKWAVGEGLVLTALLMVFPGCVLRMFGVDDPALMDAAILAVRFTAASFLFWAIESLFNSYYLFIGREMLACQLTALASFVMPYGCILAGGALMGLSGVWMGLSVAPLLALMIIGGYLLLKEGMAKFPLLLDAARDSKIFVANLMLEEKSICRVSEEMAQIYLQEAEQPQMATRVALLIEEVLMAVRDRNGARKVQAEVTLDLNDGASLVMRDDGEIFDITDADQRISSLRSYLVASLMAQQTNRINLTTTGFNRNSFRF